MNLFNQSLKEYKNKSVIYKITCTITNKSYIGSAVDFNRRVYRHRASLRADKHHSIHLQRAFNKYGEDAFIIDILELIDNPIILLEREQYYLDFYRTYDPEIGYNLCKDASSKLGTSVSEETKKKISKTLTGYRHTEETKQKISKGNIGKIMSPEHLDKMQEGLSNYIKENGHPMTGKVRSKETIDKWKESRKDYKASDETKAKMSIKQKGSNNPSSKLNDNKVIAILELYKLKTHTVQQIADLFQVTKSTIENIIYNQTWKHIPR